MKIITFDSGFYFDDPNSFWGDPSYQLEPGDPGYVGPLPSSSARKTKNRTMKRMPFFPGRAANQVPWFKNLATKLPTYGTTCGLSAGEVTDRVKDALWLAYVQGSWLPGLRTYSKACTDAVAEAQSGTGLAAQTLPVFNPSPPDAGTVPVPPGALDRLFDAIQRMKDSSAMTDAIGSDLDILGTEAPEVDLSTLKPVFVLSLSGNQVFLDWKFGGLSRVVDALEIQVDRGSGYTVLTFDTTPGYTDTTPLPATPTKWKYRAIWRVDDHQVGQWSEEMSINVG